MPAHRNVAAPEFIEARSIPEPNTGCWLWEGSATKGYGRVTVAGRRMRANRLAWEVYRGAVPDGMGVLHKCDTPQCVNPEHLFLGTQADNNDDRAAKGRTRNGGERGEAHPCAKLTDAAVREIRASCLPSRVFAVRYGVTRTAIKYVRQGKTWTHVTAEES